MVRSQITWVLKNSLGDCTADGLSSKNDKLQLVWSADPNGDPIGLTPDQVAKVPNDYLILIVRTIGGTPANYAVPASIAKGNKRPMFGGNFVYASDSRFPSDAPIHIHDRIEVPRY
tara:strand:+ start:106 stop:453 length:348 start_codon:yes stop_codon:yes gene_type:complete